MQMTMIIVEFGWLQNQTKIIETDTIMAKNKELLSALPTLFENYSPMGSNLLSKLLSYFMAAGSVVYQQFVDNCRVIHIFCFINEKQDIR